MEINLLAEQKIFHYNKMATIDEATINNEPDSIVIIAENAQHKHEQIRVLPFNAANVDKNALSFADKVQYFKKEVRPLRGDEGANPVVVVPENLAIVTTTITSFFTPEDGLDDEFALFVDGFTNKPESGYGANIDGFFTDIFVDISEGTIAELESGLAS